MFSLTSPIAPILLAAVIVFVASSLIPMVLKYPKRLQTRSLRKITSWRPTPGWPDSGSLSVPFCTIRT